jgi:hypothetical protein
MKLRQVDAIRFEPRKRVVQLIGRIIFFVAVQLRPKENLISRTVLGERFAHPSFTASPRCSPSSYP